MSRQNDNHDAHATNGRGSEGGLGPLPVRGVSYEPSRRDRMRPAELVGFSAVIALFVGLVTLMATREWALSGIAFGVVFIITLVVLAMFSLSFKPNAEESQDLDEQDHGTGA